MEQQASPATARPDPEIHARQCTICHHPQREEIEEEFVHWGHPGSIVKRFAISHRSVLYRHARALRLYEVRCSKLRSALEHIIERAAITKVSADSIVRAIHTYAHIDAHGKWEEPVRKIMKVSPVDEAKEVHIVVSQAMYDCIEKRNGRDDAQRSIRELQANPMVQRAANEAQNRHP